VGVCRANSTQLNRTARKQEDWKTGHPKTRRLENRTARKQQDWKNDYLHSAFSTCIHKFVLYKIMERK